jgi:hypothetical protein
VTVLARWGVTNTLVLFFLTLLFQSANAQETGSAARYFPKSTALYLEIEHPDQLIRKVEEHPVVDRISELKQVKQVMRSPQFAMALLVKGLVESQIDQPLLDAIKSNTAGGISVGIDTETNGIAIVFRSPDEASLRKLAGTILNVVATGAKQQGNDSPFVKKEYRDAVAAKFDGFIVARYRTWFVIANKDKLAKSIVDSMIDGTESSLVDHAWYQDAKAEESVSDVWLAIDLQALREAGVAQALFQGRTDNPGAELILGGLFDSLKNAPAAVGHLKFDKDVALSISIPFERGWATEARRFFFGERFDGAAPTPLVPKNMVASLVSYRDLADWWLSKEELFEENVIAQLAQADSQLSTIFSGMDFGQDVLGALQPGVQIVVAENKFDEKYVPDVKLPAFAMVGKLKEPEKIRRKLKIAFQSVIGFVNINLGMEGRPQLDLETETIDTAKISAAEYYFDEDTEEGLLLFNFSPTIAFQGPYLVVSSSRELALELAALAKGENRRLASEVRSNTTLAINMDVLEKVLDENRESLIAQNMLEEGNNRKQAEEAIGLLLNIVALLQDGEMDFQVKDDRMQLELLVRMDAE